MSPPVPGRSLPEPISRFHEALAMLAQDALQPFWQAVPGMPLTAKAAQEAARRVLTGYHKLEIDEDTLPPTLASPTFRAFVERLFARAENHDLSLWLGFFSANQRVLSLPHLRPEQVNALMQAYRLEVRDQMHRVMEELDRHLSGQTLSNWDMFLHARYGFCFESSGEFRESMILMALKGHLQNALFEAFLRHYVLSWNGADQQALAQAVRGYWADLWGEETQGLAAQMLIETPRDAARIHDAATLLS